MHIFYYVWVDMGVDLRQHGLGVSGSCCFFVFFMTRAKLYGYHGQVFKDYLQVEQSRTGIVLWL